MNFQPLGKRVLVKRVEETKTTASGIIIPVSYTHLTLPTKFFRCR
ncbi:hypothetical protein K1X20_08735, partial [Campylobacter jejuni]